jgi:hypothetical protein
MAATIYTPDRATQGTQQDTAALERRIRDLETRLAEVELYAPSAIVVFRPNGTPSPTLLFGPKVESMTTKATAAQLIVTFKPGSFPGYRELAGNPFPCGFGATLAITDPDYWTGATIRANITSEAPNRRLQVAILARNDITGLGFDFQTATSNTCTLLIFGGIA